MPYKDKAAELIEWIGLNFATGAFILANMESALSVIVGLTIAIFNGLRAYKLWYDIRDKKRDREFIAGEIERLHKKRQEKKIKSNGSGK